MKNKTQVLSDVIHLIELRQVKELKELKIQFHITYESLKPINLIKDTIHEVTQSYEIKNGLIKAAIQLGIGYTFKKIFIGKSTNTSKIILANILQSSVSSVLTKNI